MITDLQALILRFLIDSESMYGLEMVKKSDGQLKRGTVYVLLDRMEDSKLIKSKLVAPKGGQKGPKRRTYRITANGRTAYKERCEHQMKLFGFGGAQ